MTLNLSFVNGESQVTTYHPHDLDVAKDRMARIAEAIESMREEVSEVVEAGIETDAENEAAVGMLGSVKTIRNKWEAKRKEVIADADKFVRAVNAFARGPRGQLDKMEADLKRTVGAYAHRQELARREAERKAREAARKQQEELDRIAKEKKVEPVRLPDMVVPENREPVRTETGTASTQVVWKYRIEDAGKLPREYLMPCEREIRRAVDAGIREIPGVVIYEDVKVTMRTS